MLKYAIRGIELILLLAGAITTILILKGTTISYSCDLVFSSLIGVWSSLRGFLSSTLYICIIINFIIVLIAFSSHFHKHETKNHDDHDGITVNLDDIDIDTFESQPPPPAPPPRLVNRATPLPPLHATSKKILQNSLEKSNLSSPKPLLSNRDFTENIQELKKLPSTLYNSSKSNLSSQKPLLSNRDFTENAHELKKPTNLLKTSSKSNLSSQKPLNSNLELAKDVQELKQATIQLNNSSKSNLSSQKPLFSTPVFSQELDKTSTQPESTKPNMGTHETDSDKENDDEEDTMDATWQLITGGGKQKPKKKQLKKSETFVLPTRTNNNSNVEVKQMECSDTVKKKKELKKSETFNDAVSIRRNGGLRRDPSVGLDELNNQVEAFIKKFNADMRLQRQESDQRFLDMINQGI